MASKVKAAQKEKEKEEAPEKDAAEAPDTPLPLLDLSDAAVKKLIRTAKKRGYVTHDEINSVLPSEEVNSEQIEDVLAMFSEMGVNVVETEEASEEGEEPREEPEEEAESEGGDAPSRLRAALDLLGFDGLAGLVPELEGTTPDLDDAVRARVEGLVAARLAVLPAHHTRTCMPAQEPAGERPGAPTLRCKNQSARAIRPDSTHARSIRMGVLGKPACACESACGRERHSTPPHGRYT